MSVKLLSIVCPCYNEASCVNAFVETVRNTIPMEQPYEIVFVDDGSTDETLAKIKELVKHDKGVLRYLSFSRNFGKESALLAGLKGAKGDVIVTMDVDLQDPPEFLPQMLTDIESGWDCVATRRCTRAGEPQIRSWFARRFYELMRHFSDVELVDGARDYRMMTRQVLEAIVSMPENNRFTKGIYQWVGFKTKWLSFENVKRIAGETKWSFWNLFRYAVDGILAFSTAPLQIASWLGILSCICAFTALLWIFIRALLFGDPVAGWPSTVCIIIFLGGLQLFGIGILGAYLSKVYLETKRRPMYFIREEG